jgi:hypothetical protein
MTITLLQIEFCCTTYQLTSALSQRLIMSIGNCPLAGSLLFQSVKNLAGDEDNNLRLLYVRVAAKQSCGEYQGRTFLFRWGLFIGQNKIMQTLLNCCKWCMFYYFARVVFRIQPEGYWPLSDIVCLQRVSRLYSFFIPWESIKVTLR